MSKPHTTFECLRDVARAPDHPIAMPLHETIEDLGLALGQPRITSKRGLLIRCACTDCRVVVFSAVRLVLDL